MWTNDSQRFLLEHFDTIKNSPSQLYHSALPFSPSSSWLHEYYSLELSQEVKVVEGLPGDWGTCSCTVLLNDSPWTLSYWNNTIAIGSTNKDILILDTITSSQTAVLSGHTDAVRSLIFSSDGILLVSGSYDKTVKLWDVQTGGIVKTFHGPTKGVHSVSISADHTTVASGCGSGTLHLWDIQTGGCHQIIEHEVWVSCVRFSPTNPQCLVSVSNGTVQQWDIDGHIVGPTYNGHEIAFSPDGSQLILCGRGDVTIQDINSGLVVVKFNMPDSFSSLGGLISRLPTSCCFSPDHKFVAVAAAHNIYIWDITSPDPYLVETFIGHTTGITSLTFSSPSTLISASRDRSVKFWQIGTSSTGTIVTDSKSTPLTLAPTKSIALKVKNGLIIPSDLPEGVMKTWGILTGLHNESLQILAENTHQSNTQLIDGKLIFVWYTDEKINIWDTEKGELLQTINVSGGSVMDLKVLGDGCKVFCLYKESFQVWDIWTGEVVGKLRAQDVNTGTSDKMNPGEEVDILAIDGSRIWVYVFVSASRAGKTYVWDCGILGSPTAQFPSSTDSIYLNDTKVWECYTSRIMDTVTGKVVFQLPKRFGRATHVQWNGHYLVVSFKPKEAVVLDFSLVPF